MKTKSLIKKFSFGELQKTCEREGWSIPTIEEAKKFEGSAYDLFWVLDLPKHKDDIETHAILYERSTDRKYIVNKNHLQLSVVIVNIKRCEWKKQSDHFETSCGQAFVICNLESLTDNKFKHCIYCGNEIKEV